MSTRAVVIGRCAFCRWKAQLTADDDLEAKTSLHDILINHVRDDHPEQEGGYVRYYPLPSVPP